MQPALGWGTGDTRWAVAPASMASGRCRSCTSAITPLARAVATGASHVLSCSANATCCCCSEPKASANSTRACCCALLLLLSPPLLSCPVLLPVRCSNGTWRCHPGATPQRQSRPPGHSTVVCGTSLCMARLSSEITSDASSPSTRATSWSLGADSCDDPPARTRQDSSLRTQRGNRARSRKSCAVPTVVVRPKERQHVASCMGHAWRTSWDMAQTIAMQGRCYQLGSKPFQVAVLSHLLPNPVKFWDLFLIQAMR